MMNCNRSFWLVCVTIFWSRVSSFHKTSESLYPTPGPPGTLYVLNSTSKRANLFALEAETGVVKWLVDIDSGGPPAVGPDGRIYACTIGPVSSEGSGQYLWAFDPDGRAKWQFDLALGEQDEPDVCGAPVFRRDGTIILAVNSIVMAVSPEGHEEWRTMPFSVVDPYTEKVETPRFSPDGSVMYVAVGQYLKAMSPEDGSVLWNFTRDLSYLELKSPDVGSDGTIYVLDSPRVVERNEVIAVRPDGEYLWSYSLGARGSSSGRAGEDMYYAHGTDALHALRSDGTEAWEIGGNFSSYIVPVVAVASDGTVYCEYVADHYVVTVRAVAPDGSLKWIFDTEAAGLGSFKGQTIAISEDGTIFAEFLNLRSVGTFGSRSDLAAINPDGSLKWSMVKPDPRITVRSRRTGRCLDLPGADATDGNPLWTWECLGADNQQWALLDGSIVYAGSVKNNVGMCVGVTSNDTTLGGDVDIEQCEDDAHPFQQWGYDPEFGTFYLSNSAGDATRCLDLPEGADTDGDRVQLWECLGNSNQQWDIVSVAAPLRATVFV